MKQRALTWVFAVACLSGCGVASVAPVVTERDMVNDPRLAGEWTGGRESAVITSTGPGTFNLLYNDENGKSGRFHARLGQLGSYRILDLEPEDPAPAASDAYRSLLLRAHGIVVIDSVGEVIQFRILETDSVKAYLRRKPKAVAHTLVGDAVLLTAPSGETRQFLIRFFKRPAVLSEMNVWRPRTR